jgi:uncharacterized membrane-anchored protein YhcB (DUF1043 family)
MNVASSLIFLAAGFVFVMGMLLGHTITERALRARAKRQAALQRSLNSQQQELVRQRHKLAALRVEDVD